VTKRTGVAGKVRLEIAIMKAHDVYRVNSPQVIYENIDGELILVHMEKGAYYTTDEVGAALWDLIESRCTVSEMCEALAAQFEAGPEEIAAATASFLEVLIAEELVLPEDPAADRPARPRAPSAARRPFRVPGLQPYRDMQDMLALDPIHDVEAAGWPVPRAEADTSVTSQSA
jgi:Coenzyme PQQ synthesis protein D (PqqD)